MSTQVPVGAVVEEVYFSVPESYGIGTKYATFVEARDAAIAKWQRIVDEVAPLYPGWEDAVEIAMKAADPQCVVDERWDLRFPKGGGVDRVMERTNVAHMARKAVRV